MWLEATRVHTEGSSGEDRKLGLCKELKKEKKNHRRGKRLTVLS